jgi:Meiotically up-regulated gene 113
VMDKKHIIDAIKRVAEANGGKPPGRAVIESHAGIRMSDWYPHLWLRWSDALVEAGFTPNKLQGAISPDDLVKKFIDLTRELGKIPVDGEVRRRARADKSFPSHNAFSKFGGKEKLIEAALRYCQQHQGFDDVIALCADQKPKAVLEPGTGGKVVTAFVYLMKSGRHYKIGRTVSEGRRNRELAIQIPIPPKTIHTIETDDPVGVEAYWHNRFREKRGAGEWFDLSPDDVRAFKRWKRIV